MSLEKDQAKATKNLKKALIGRTIIDAKDDPRNGVLDIRLDNDTALIISTQMFGMAEVKKKEKKMSKPNKTYKPKDLIAGFKINQTPDSQWVAIPDKLKDYRITVEYNGTTMIIEDWRNDTTIFKTFQDKFWTPTSGRPKTYVLGYFKFTSEDTPM